jgi:3-isopropylmalate dehydrogenase
VVGEVVAEYPEIELQRAYVDAAALYLVRRPQTFDVIVTENMFGDILSDLTAGLVGGMGMAPSADIGVDHAVFQPAHGSAVDIAGQGAANPIAAVLSVKMMLEHLGRKHREPRLAEAAATVRRAVDSLFADTPQTTPDLGGSMTSQEVGIAVCERIERSTPPAS